MEPVVVSRLCGTGCYAERLFAWGEVAIPVIESELVWTDKLGGEVRSGNCHANRRGHTASFLKGFQFIFVPNSSAAAVEGGDERG
jgi:hypothetical protein